MSTDASDLSWVEQLSLDDIETLTAMAFATMMLAYTVRRARLGDDIDDINAALTHMVNRPSFTERQRRLAVGIVVYVMEGGRGPWPVAEAQGHH